MPIDRSRGRRVALFAAVLYGATCLGTAFVVLTSPVCTQYGMPGAIPAGPLVMLAGLLVILALTYAGLREGVTPAILSLLISLGVFAGLWIAARAAWRALRSGPLVSVGTVLFALALVVLNAVTTFFFCLSMSA